MLNLNTLLELALPSTSLMAKDGALQLHLEDMLCNDDKAERQGPIRIRLTHWPTSLCGSALGASASARS